jgi:hypothetical protein
VSTLNPPRPATLDAEGVRTISRYLNNPTLITRRLRQITDRQFVGDRILRGRVVAAGGMVEYETGESIFPRDAPEEIEPGGEYPMTTIPVGTAVIEAVKKTGLATEVTLESVKRRGTNPVERAELKLANGVVKNFDDRTMSKIAAAQPQMNTLAGTSWATATDTAILRMILNAVATVIDLREGYRPTALLLDNFKYALLASSEKLLTLIDRETDDLEFIRSPSGTAVTDPIVFDPDQLGSIVQEDFGTANAANNGVEALSEYHVLTSPTGGAEKWTLGAKRVALPIVQEPKSACRITGT